MDRKPISIALIGAGSMGGALLEAWLANNLLDGPRSSIFDPGIDDHLAQAARAVGLTVNGDIDNAQAAALMVFAVKPQMADTVLPVYRKIADHACAVSVMAGKNIATISSLLGRAADREPAVIRAMPNIPASVGAGMTGLYAGPTVTAAMRDATERLMRAAGGVVWVGDENGIDHVTAISGSGPAYFFLLAEALAEAGVELGLPEETASILARETLIGAGALQQSAPDDPAILRQRVTSPGGTTAAAINVLDGEDAFRPLLKRATLAAARRAKELTGLFNPPV